MLRAINILITLFYLTILYLSINAANNNIALHNTNFETNTNSEFLLTIFSNLSQHITTILKYKKKSCIWSSSQPGYLKVAFYIRLTAETNMKPSAICMKTNDNQVSLLQKLPSEIAIYLSK